MTQMNYFTYKKGQEMAACDYPFYVLLQALMRQAKADNLEKLCNAFPDVWKELANQFGAPAKRHTAHVYLAKPWSRDHATFGQNTEIGGLECA